LSASTRVRPGPWPAAVGSPDADAVQHGLELRAVPALSGGEHQGQQPLVLLAGQVQLGAPAAARAAQPVIGRFRVTNPAGRLDLAAAVVAGAGGVLMRRATVESTDTSQPTVPAASARSCSAASSRAQVPSRCQRRNRP
jgi:hypothetical protein